MANAQITLTLTPREFAESIMGAIATHGHELAANHDMVFKLVERIESQQERIERLEQIIFTMSGGSESSLPDAGEKHTHWIYPLSAKCESELAEEQQNGKE